MDRRNLLRVLGLALLNPGHLRRRKAQGAAKGTTALVIGAGIAGLAAARGLKEHGFEVVVLEGRRRAGGRIRTDRSLGAPVELGANWLENADANPLLPLAKELGLRLSPSDFEATALYDQDGVRFDQDELEGLLEDLDDLSDRLDERARRTAGDISLGQAVAEDLAKQKASEEDRRKLDWALSTEVWEYAAELSQLSLLHFDPDPAADPEDLAVGGGYDRIIEHLARGLDIRFEQEVSRVEYDEKRVRVFAGPARFEAEVAVVTLPLGVLKTDRVAFEPALPERKRKAISRLAMGLLNKIVLAYPRRFWPDDVEFLGYVPREGGGFRHFVNEFPATGKPILTAIAAGGHARELERWKDSEIVAGAQRVLRKIYGRGVPEPEGVQVSRWGADRFTFGSYSYVPVGSSGDDYDALAEPVSQRLLFAGEATHRRFPSTVHGAYLSGLREAERAAGMAARP
ncbi:MAG TPA: FAD-dependent oxidoreductase [Pirellulales bacterium]|nr:FAD-dependent oxidoreductase [Pirellulales bacterium]